MDLSQGNDAPTTPLGSSWRVRAMPIPRRRQLEWTTTGTVEAAPAKRPATAYTRSPSPRRVGPVDYSPDVRKPYNSAGARRAAPGGRVDTRGILSDEDLGRNVSPHRPPISVWQIPGSVHEGSPEEEGRAVQTTRSDHPWGHGAEGLPPMFSPKARSSRNPFCPLEVPPQLRCNIQDPWDKQAHRCPATIQGRIFSTKGRLKRHYGEPRLT